MQGGSAEGQRLSQASLIGCIEQEERIGLGNDSEASQARGRTKPTKRAGVWGPHPTADGRSRHPGAGGACLGPVGPSPAALREGSWEDHPGEPLEISQPSCGPFQEGIPNASQP